MNETHCHLCPQKYNKPDLGWLVLLYSDLATCGIQKTYVSKKLINNIKKQ